MSEAQSRLAEAIVRAGGIPELARKWQTKMQTLRDLRDGRRRFTRLWLGRLGFSADTALTRGPVTAEARAEVVARTAEVRAEAAGKRPYCASEDGRKRVRKAMIRGHDDEPTEHERLMAEAMGRERRRRGWDLVTSRPMTDRQKQEADRLAEIQAGKARKQGGE